MIHKSELPLRRLAPIWWAFIWRALIAGVVAGGAAGFVIGVVMGLLGLESHIEAAGSAAGFLVAIPVGLWAMRSALTKRYKGFELALVTEASHF